MTQQTLNHINAKASPAAALLIEALVGRELHPSPMSAAAVLRALQQWELAFERSLPDDLLAQYLDIAREQTSFTIRNRLRDSTADMTGMIGVASQEAATC